MAKISCPWCWMNAECRRPSPSLESDPIDFPLCSATILPISCGPGNGNSIPVRARQFFALFHQEIGRTERADSRWIDMSVGSTCLAAIWSWRLSSFSCFSYVTWWDAQQNATPINHWQLLLWPPNLIPFQHLKKNFFPCVRELVLLAFEWNIYAPSGIGVSSSLAKFPHLSSSYPHFPVLKPAAAMVKSIDRRPLLSWAGFAPELRAARAMQ